MLEAQTASVRTSAVVDRLQPTTRARVRARCRRDAAPRPVEWFELDGDARVEALIGALVEAFPGTVELPVEGS